MGSTFSSVCYSEEGQNEVIIFGFFCMSLFTTSAQIASCDVFQEGLCNLDENNIVGAYTDVATAIECQELCLSFAECNFFSFIGIQCFLVKTCDTLDLAEGCISGPKEPSLESCQDTTFPPSTAPPTSAAPTTTTPPPTTTLPMCNVT